MITTSSRLDCMRACEQLATLWNCMTLGMKSVLKNAIDIDLASDMLSVKNVLTSIEAHLRGQRHIIHDLVDFHERHQGYGETFNSFYCALKEIAANCDLSSMTVEQQFVIRIITGNI